MENSPIKVLLVDDDQDDYVITRDLLSEIGDGRFHLDWVDRYDLALEMIGGNQHDVYLLDFHLGEWSGMELLREAIANGCKAPMILLTGQGDHEVDIEAMKAGAADYLAKGQIDASLLERSIRYGIERKRTEEALLEGKKKLEDANQRLQENQDQLIHQATLLEAQTETSIDGILAVDDEGKSILFNRHFGEMWNIPRNISDTRDEERMLQYMLSQLRDPEGFLKKVKHLHIHKDEKSRDEIEFKDGKVFDGYSSPLIDPSGRYHGRIWYFRDITEKKTFERQLMQSSRLAGIGELAAGVAHEINNPIGFVTSNTNSLDKYFKRISQVLQNYRELHGNKDTMSREDMVRKIEKIEVLANELNIEKALKGADQTIKENIDGLNRVAKIIKDLKTFSRTSDEKEEGVNINQILEDTLNLVRNEIKYKAEVVKDYGDIRPISCISSQLAQVFTNILVNAAQAIEKQGVITVKTYEEDGNVAINIKDTGSGMNKETLDKIFNPFFTTKETGKGTGLGLSIAHQIIEKHKGDIHVKSEPGKGTSFEIRLPMN